jgi:hypothetical protein
MIDLLRFLKIESTITPVDPKVITIILSSTRLSLTIAAVLRLVEKLFRTAFDAHHVQVIVSKEVGMSSDKGSGVNDGSQRIPFRCYPKY